MPFGLKNAPAMFSRVVISAFKEFIHKFLEVYFDDWTIFGLVKDHIASLRLMLDKCRQHHISLNLKKCIFCVPFGILLVLYTWMAPLCPSADIPHVGTQKDIYGLRLPVFIIPWLMMKYIVYMPSWLLCYFEILSACATISIDISRIMREYHIQQGAHTSMRGLLLYRVAYHARVAPLQTHAWFPQN